MLRIEGVSSRHADGLVLDGVTMRVSAGALVVVLGPSGSGKSTLLAIAAAARRPDEGAVWLADRNIAGLQASSLPYVRRNIGYMAHKPLLVPDETVLENIMLALAVRGEPVDVAEADAHEVLSLLGDSSWEDHRAASLSSGQQRLVALARALVGPPPLVVVDEPASGLGDDDREAVIKALAWTSQRGAAVLCGTSDEAFAEAIVRSGGRRLCLERGRIAGLPAIDLVPALEPAKANEPPENVVTPRVEQLSGEKSREGW